MGCELLRCSFSFPLLMGTWAASFTRDCKYRILSKLYLYWVNSLPGVLISYCCYNCNKFSGLTYEKCSCGSQKSEMGLPGVKSKCWQGCLPLEALGKNPFSCLFHLEAVCFGSRPPSSMALLRLPLLSSSLLCLSFFSLIRSHVIILDIPEYSRTVVSSQSPKVNHISKVPFAL